MNFENEFGFVSLNQDSPEVDNDLGFVPFDQEIDEKPSIGSEVTRHGVRSASRVAETALGLPGDVVRLLQVGIGKGLGKLTGNKLLEESILQGPSSISSDEFTPENIPSSSELRQGSEEVSRGFTAPQSPEEEFSDEVISDLTSLALPLGKTPSFLKTLGIAVGSNLAKLEAEQLGADEKGQAATKLGSMFLIGLINRKNANDFVKNLYENARSKIPQGTMLPAENLLKDLGKVETEISKGISTSSKEQVVKAINDLQKKAAGGAIPAEDLVQSYHDVNEIMSSKRLFDELSKTERKVLKTRFDKFKGAVSKSVADYGKYNPEFYDAWKSANEGFGAIQQSKKVSQMLGKVLKVKNALYASPALMAFHYFHPATIPSLIQNPYILGGAAATAGALKGSELLYRIGKSPTLRKHYMNVINDSLKDNVKGASRNLLALDKDLKKELSFEALQEED